MQPFLRSYDRSSPWLILQCLVWPNITERTDMISCLRAHAPQSPCSVPKSLCLGPNPSSEREYLRWGVGERNPRQRGICTLRGYKRRLGTPEEAVRELGSQGWRLGTFQLGLAGERSFPMTGLLAWAQMQVSLWVTPQSSQQMAVCVRKPK